MSADGEPLLLHPVLDQERGHGFGPLPAEKLIVEALRTGSVGMSVDFHPEAVQVAQAGKEILQSLPVLRGKGLGSGGEVQHGFPHELCSLFSDFPCNGLSRGGTTLFRVRPIKGGRGGWFGCDRSRLGFLYGSGRGGRGGHCNHGFPCLGFFRQMRLFQVLLPNHDIRPGPQ